ncbi:putative PROBABLE SHORT-CHAIN TYPE DEHYDROGENASE/REDUCTASE [Streptomyces scabiei 87.22]|uniref:NAD(P)-dependent dehydrogenase (Short-subunit alcohol dehydrogenase family) n=3 Tax=Streptomyces TaxID=1883 RepID=A0A8I0TXR9_9ACTN|nr:NAD(P)-dependent dehydrogenase (short-subunit alcohol dehydrogenase family) [Streptomyces stelliscabiei]MDH6454357.1 NAD(P)-dependent dehydrogenase (short-subunit alcohol dehydrogenase family) [Streptomyces sp. SAI-119]MDH6495084.1 NAD(P)-dependent dehydrogenase (short-subunit alcohol dehydrogenase family) [Streptomyces sp. SAI-149]CBG68550.1 putative PROBABLE SHORT-CHAIN TYPE DEHYDROGENASE/REDUCTASE [Streptomyces scabiei 87.22]
MVDVHLLGTIWMCRAVWPHMRDAGYGRIVNTTSPGMLGSGYGSVYGAVKAGSYGLTRSLAIEGDPFGIRANALAPLAATIAWDVVQAPGKEAMDGPVAQDMSPDLIAPTAALLAHRVCPFSGKNITADPGRVSETYYRQTAGYAKVAPTIEELNDSLRQVVDRSDAHDIGDPAEAATWVGGPPPVPSAGAARA